MKKLILLFLLLPSLAWGGESTELARMSPMIYGGDIAAAATCTTVHATNESAHSSYVVNNTETGDHWTGQWDYNPGSNISVCKVDFVLTAHGTITTYNYYIDIYTTTGTGTPKTLDTLLGSSNSVTGSGSWDGTTVSFSFSTPVSISSGTLYAIVLRTDGAASGTNYASVSISAAGGFGGYSGRWDDDKLGTNWGSGDVRMTIYK